MNQSISDAQALSNAQVLLQRIPKVIQRQGPDIPEGLLSTRQAASFLSVNEATLRSWAKTGQIPSFRLPGKTAAFRFDPAELRIWIRSQ